LEGVLGELEGEGNGQDGGAGTGQVPGRKPRVPRDWRPRLGDRALIVSLRQVGRIVEDAGGHTFVLDTGRLRVRVPASDLAPAPAGEEAGHAPDGSAAPPGTSPETRATAAALSKAGQV